MAICIPPILNFIKPEVLAALAFLGQAFKSGPLANRNVLYSGFCGTPEPAPIGSIPLVGGLAATPDLTQIEADFQKVLEAIWKSELQGFLDDRRAIYEQAADSGVLRGGVVPYRVEHDWRSRVWGILSRLYGAYRQYTFEGGDLQSLFYDIQAENWRRRQMNNDLSRINEATLYQRQLESREMIGNLLTQCAIFAPPAEE